MKAILLVVGLIGLAGGCWFTYQYMYTAVADAKRTDLVIGGVAFAIALICFAIFFFKKFREEGEQGDISITKF
ncbi:MAG TPA: hypothetical protein VKM94_10635 [Blastocatellia bacterium]|nr:hypothetical protein [Blastocatellia bacterium]